MVQLVWADLTRTAVEQYGNVASVLGLLISLYLVWRVKKEAELVRTATNEALQRFEAQLFVHDIADILQLLLDARHASRVPQWSRAVEKCEEARVRLAQIRKHRALTADEREAVVSGVDNLRLIIEYLEGIGRGPNAPTGLSRPKKSTLDNLIAVLSEIKGRVQIANWER